MIDPKELRLGNYYYSVVVKDLRQIWAISRGENTMQPIPLTDAVLEACGFEKDYPIYRVPHESLPHIEKNGDKQTKDYGKWLWFNKHGGMEVSVGASFQYLHQLQNLYFALTGKELEIDKSKLKTAIC